MAMPIRGTRTIEVDGELYHWRLQRRSQATNLVIVAELAKNPGAALVAQLGRPYIDIWLRFPDPILPNETIPVGPGEVAERIRAALIAGWHPKETGRAFLLNRPSTHEATDLNQ